ncbi:MAG: cyanoglobin [Paracoccaceae bacterium]|nr:cyanoglobin [Paracoccaceae bacterium]MDG2260028.1 cyanoglobin [Paracoccaceae bacterium]
MMAMLDEIGGEEAVAKIVTRFYDLMETLPEAHSFHRLHFRGHGLDHTRTEQLNFMIGFLVGRQYYREKHGHMDLHEIHAHVPIRDEDAEVWLQTWDQALSECGASGEDVDRMRSIVARVARKLVNDVPDWRLDVV